MLLGTVKEVGPAYKGELKVGDKIATLVSLSLTPLVIEEILEMRPTIDQVDISALLFPDLQESFRYLQASCHRRIF